MKVLIASSDMEASRQLNRSIGKIAPVATYLHADCAERVIDLFEHHRIDLVLLDLQLVAKNQAAASLLRMLNPGALAFTPLEQQLESLSRSNRPGVLLTFDGGDLRSSADAVVNRLQGVAQVSMDPPGASNGTAIWAQSDQGEWKAVEVQGLQWAVSEQGRVRLRHVSNRDYFVRDRLKELERKLSNSNFVRIHKSYLVNSEHVREVERWSSGGLLVRMDCEKETRLPVSRRYASRFRKRTGLSIGPVAPPRRVLQAAGL